MTSMSRLRRASGPAGPTQTEISARRLDGKPPVSGTGDCGFDSRGADREVRPTGGPRSYKPETRVRLPHLVRGRSTTAVQLPDERPTRGSTPPSPTTPGFSGADELTLTQPRDGSSPSPGSAPRSLDVSRPLKPATLVRFQLGGISSESGTLRGSCNLPRRAPRGRAALRSRDLPGDRGVLVVHASL